MILAAAWCTCPLPTRQKFLKLFYHPYAIFIAMTLTVDMVRPHLEDLTTGKTTQSALARALGVSQPSLSKFVLRHFGPDASPGNGGRHPTTTDEMLAAVAECEDTRANIAAVARKYGLPYLALAKRVQKRREKLAAEKEAYQKAERDALLAQIPAAQFPPAQPTALPDAERLAQELAANPDKVIALAKALKALGL